MRAYILRRDLCPEELNKTITHINESAVAEEALRQIELDKNYAGQYTCYDLEDLVNLSQYADFRPSEYYLRIFE